MPDASTHPRFTETGLSAGVGGWIARRPFRYQDPVYAGSLAEMQQRVHEQLEGLLASGRIRLEALPPALLPGGRLGGGPLPADRVKGALWGVAIGDALGNTSESLRPSERRSRYGEIRGYLPNRHAHGERLGLPSDDTQLTVWTLETLLEHGWPDPGALAQAFRQHRLYGIGGTLRGFFRKLDQLGPGADPWEARQFSAGNGALMRVAGALLPHAWTLDAHALEAVAVASALTHDDPTSTASCVAFARILGLLLQNPDFARPGFFWETFVETARPLEGAPQLRSRVPGNAFQGSLCDLVEQQVPQALRQGKSIRSAGEHWYSGAYLLETVPTVLHLLECHFDDPEEAMVRAVTDTWDNDTIAALVGMVLGALHGASAFPHSWRASLSERTTDSDAGRLSRAYGTLRQLGGFGLRD